MSKKAHELTFQHHIEDFFIREHQYGMLEQTTSQTPSILSLKTISGHSSKQPRLTRSKSSRMTTALMRGTRYSAPCAKNWSTHHYGYSSATG